MKIVVTGKGGAGKSTVAGTLSRHLARRGHRVITVDCDPSPNVGITLGLSVDEVENQIGVLNGLIASGHTHHDPKPDAETLLERFGLDTPDGVRLIASGRIEIIPEACMCCGSHAATRSLFSDISDDGRIVVADLEAGLNDMLWVKPSPDDVVIAVTETSAKAVEIARRAARIAEMLGVGTVFGVANRCTDGAHLARVTEALGVPVIAVPDDLNIARADRQGVSPIDLDPDSPAVVAIGGLADRVLGA